MTKYGSVGTAGPCSSVAKPPVAAATTAFLSIAWLMACRTRTSASAGFASFMDSTTTPCVLPVVSTNRGSFENEESWSYASDWYSASTPPDRMALAAALASAK